MGLFLVNERHAGPPSQKWSNWVWPLETYEKKICDLRKEDQKWLIIFCAKRCTMF